MEFLLSYLAAHRLEVITVFVSLLWLYLEYRASIWLWPVGIILPLLWIPIAWRAHGYAVGARRESRKLLSPTYPVEHWAIHSSVCP